MQHGFGCLVLLPQESLGYFCLIVGMSQGLNHEMGKTNDEARLYKKTVMCCFKVPVSTEQWGYVKDTEDGAVTLCCSHGIENWISTSPPLSISVK